MAEELDVITTTHDLIVWMVGPIGKFPRSHRFVLAERMDNTQRSTPYRARKSPGCPDLRSTRSSLHERGRQLLKPPRWQGALSPDRLELVDAEAAESHVATCDPKVELRGLERAEEHGHVEQAGISRTDVDGAVVDDDAQLEPAAVARQLDSVFPAAQHRGSEWLCRAR